MAKRKRTNNTMPKEKGQTIQWPEDKRTNNTMAKRKKTNNTMAKRTRGSQEPVSFTWL
jgi:hypothetical protein